MTPTEIEGAPTEAPVDKRGLGRLLLGIVLWPRSTFAYLREHGGRSWLLPLLLVLVLTAASRYVALPIEKARADAAIAAIQAQLAAQGQSNPNKGNVFISTGPAGGFPGSSSSPLLAYGLPLAGVVWDWLFRGAVLLAALAGLLGGRPAPGAMFRMSGWTLLPNVARLTVAVVFMLVAQREPVAGLQGLGAGAADVTINGSPSNSQSADTQTFRAGPGGAGGPSSLAFPSLLQSAFLGALDLYTFWSLVLMLIGVAVTARVGWLKSAVSTAVYWGLSLVLATVPPLLTFLLISVARPGGVVGP